MNNDIRIYSHNAGYGVAAFYAIIFLLLPVTGFALVRAILSSDTFILPSPGIVALGFGAPLLFMLIPLFRNIKYALRFARKPVLVFDERGITDQTGLVSLGLIHWDEIKEIFCCEVFTSSGRGLSSKKENALGIVVREREDILSRFGLLDRLMVRRRSRPGFFIIRTSGLKIYGNNVSALMLKVAKAFPIKLGKFRGVGDKS